ncbi:HAMP domain-containing sensor histidine kinase [Pengzhenrongella sp.]|jgi:signal transduction histidine kinase|uniref:sensor histidine kinase n=1 Tax=Pengzhenrongella sp. TaxID=2888820 RepID=UPI002F95BC97
MSAAALRRRRAPLGFAWRLAASLALVVLAGGVTLLVVALLVAPEIFQAHLRMVPGAGIEPTLQGHVNEAFANAVLVSLGVAVPVSLLTALAVAWIAARRLGRSVAAVAAAADRIARGNLRARVEVPAIGPEFAQLADAFNAMADRLADTETTRTRLIGDLAHELRTPLASLEATVEAVVDGVLAADGETLTTLADQTARLQRLVEDMAAVSRAEERHLDLHPELLDPVLAAREAVGAAHARFAAAQIRLDVDVADDVPAVRVDAQRLGEVLANLLDNALRHSSAGGQVRVVLRADHGDAVWDVIDTGDGFDPSDAERIFERFYRADPSRTRTSAGSGIGLTIARAIAQAHGGTLEATSAGPGTGATFRLRLPPVAAGVRSSS